MGNTPVWVLPDICGKLGLPTLAGMCRIKYYWLLQNPRVTAFIVSELLRENQQGGGYNYTSPTHIRVKYH